MAQNIPTLFVDEYKQRIELALQHNGSVYRSAVSERPASGAPRGAGAVRRIGRAEMLVPGAGLG